MLERKRKSVIRTLGRYLTEIVIIFIGITISFMFDGWRESRNNQQSELDFIESLLLDLQFKKDEIKFEFNLAKKFSDRADSAFRAYENHTFLSDETKSYLIDSYNLDNNFFSSSTPSFNITSTNDLYKQLPDTLRRQLFSLYSSFEYQKITFEKLAQARFDFKKRMSSIGVLYANPLFNQDGTLQKKCDCELLKNFVSSTEFINNLHLIRSYENQKQQMLLELDKGVDRVISYLQTFETKIKN